MIPKDSDTEFARPGGGKIVMRDRVYFAFDWSHERMTSREVRERLANLFPGYVVEGIMSECEVSADGIKRWRVCGYVTKPCTFGDLVADHGREEALRLILGEPDAFAERKLD